MPFSIALISTDDTNTASGTLKKANSAPAASKIINTAQSSTPTVDAKKRFNGNTFAKQENARQAEHGGNYFPCTDTYRFCNSDEI